MEIKCKVSATDKEYVYMQLPHPYNREIKFPASTIPEKTEVGDYHLIDYNTLAPGYIGKANESDEVKHFLEVHVRIDNLKDISEFSKTYPELKVLSFKLFEV